jgi:hypothetical protein
MDIIDTKTTEELHRSIIAELAKARNELSCARGDLDKANNRISFLLAIVNSLIQRQHD